MGAYKEPEPTYHTPEPAYKEPDPTYKEPEEPKYHAPLTKPVIEHGFKPVHSSGYHAAPVVHHHSHPVSHSVKKPVVIRHRPAKRPRRPSLLGRLFGFLKKH